MNPEYAIRWFDGLVHSTLIIEDGLGGQAIVADVWFDGNELQGAVDVHYRVSLNGEARALYDAVAATDDIDEAKALVEGWLLETWGIKGAYDRLTGAWI